MESLLSNIPPAEPRVQRRQHSDTVGCHLEDTMRSEALKRRDADINKRHTKSIIKPKHITYFSTHNVNSLMQVGKLKVITDLMDQHKILIMGLQEIRNTDQDVMESQGYRLYKGIPGKRAIKSIPQFGTGFLVSLKIINSVQDFKSQSSRISTLTLKASNKVYTIINAHAPTNNKNISVKDRKEADKFWDLLDHTINNIPKNHVKLLIGDFNAQLGKERRYRDIIGKWPAQRRTNKNGEKLVDLCRNHNLISKSTYFKRKPHKLKTWKHPDHTKGEWQLDHVFMDKQYHREIYNVKVLRGVDTGSDHYVVKIKIKLTPNRKQYNQTPKLKRKMDPTQLIKNEDYRKATEKIKITDKLEDLVNNMKQIAEELAPVKPRKKHQWWNNECDETVEKRHQAWLLHQSQKSEISFQNLVKQRKDTTKTLRRIKRQYHKDTLELIEKEFNKTQSRDYYKIFKKQLQKYEAPTLLLQDENGELAHNNEDNAKILAKYFNQLLNCEAPEELLNLDINTPIVTSPENINPPTIKEVYQALDEMKNYKAPGEDQTFAEIWKYAGSSAKIALHQQLINIWIKEELPEHWTTAIIHPLHKKGDKTDPNNYRGISLLDIAYKIFSRIILNRIKLQLEKELGDYQGGFRPWRSCSDQIMSLKLIMDYNRKRNRDMVISFIDFKKAYDCIHRESLLKILRHLGLHPKLINLIKLTLTNTKSKVKFRGELSEPFEIKTGLRQGDGLSPLLFNCALEIVMREWVKKCPPKIKIGRNIKTNCLGFADDLALLANDLDEAKTQISELQNIASKIGLKISFEKTEIMTQKPTSLREININGNKIKIVTQFKYLGEIITNNLNEKTSIQMRTNKLARAQKLTWNTYKKKCLSINAKLKHYNSVIKPEATYAAETLFHLNEQSKTDKLQKVERRIGRTCINKTYQKDGQWRILPNKLVYKELEPITDTMRKRRLGFFGHIMRMQDSRLLKQLVQYNLASKNTTTGCRWIREIRDDLKEIGLTPEDTINKTEFKKKLKDINPRFTLTRRKFTTRIFSTQERARRSDRMKKYWQDRKARTAPQ